MLAAAAQLETGIAPAEQPAPKASLTAQVLFAAGGCYILAELLFMYSRRHIPLCNCMPMRLVLPEGEPDLMVAAAFFWYAAGVLLLFAAYRIIQALQGRNLLESIYALLPAALFIPIQIDVRRYMDDPKLRPTKPTRQLATDAIIFLLASALNAALSFIITAIHHPPGTEDERYALKAVSVIAAVILGLEGIRRGASFLVEWWNVIAATGHSIREQAVKAFRQQCPFLSKEKRPSFTCSRTQLRKHLLATLLLFPVAHLALLLCSYQFPPADAGYWHHSGILILDESPFGDLYTQRFGDKHSVTATTRNEVYDWAPDPQFGTYDPFGLFLWFGPRWYFRNAWDVSLQLSEKNVETQGWTKEWLAEQTRKLKAALDTIPAGSDVSGDELAAIASASNGRFVFTPDGSSYVVGCDGRNGLASVSKNSRYRYLLTEDTLLLQKGDCVRWLDCQSGLEATARLTPAPSTDTLTGFRASLPFALVQVWLILLLLLAPGYYVQFKNASF